MRKSKFFLGMGILVIIVYMSLMKVEAAPLQSNPNISWSPDGQAFTTDAGETDHTVYEKGMIVKPGGIGNLQPLEEGQHYYYERKTGSIPIEQWKVFYTPGKCIHNIYPEENWHGIEFGTHKCLNEYKSGWIATCADCQEEIKILFYMDKETAQSISELSSLYTYYYMCPRCDNLEQGVEIKHKCKEISWNQYYVEYDENAGNVTGNMPNSKFIYNNENIYEGIAVTPDTKLSECTFVRSGYEFIGWNTKRDGSGRSFSEQAEIFNLTKNNEETITLYAQWEKCESELYVDPNGGRFNGHLFTTYVKQGYGTTYSVAGSLVTPPTGPTVSFETNGGAAVADKEVELRFSYWQMSSPFYGKLEEDFYTFGKTNDAKDYLTAQYEPLSITLPSTSKQGAEFGGWYKDAAFTIPAGQPGDEVIITEDTTLYAQWVSLQLTAVNDYSVYGGSGAVDLSWVQNDSYIKTYRLYQSLDNRNWTKLSYSGNSGIVSVSEDFAATETEATYTVPYSGFYTLTLTGAQGEDYDSHTGGKGGRVTATVWLSKGEILTYKIGSTEGFNGGGTGVPFGNGGGMTSISSNQKGLLLIAGGGGGASSQYDGGAGGMAQSVTNMEAGESGDVGGGGGFKGGTAGEVDIHFHTADCFTTVTDVADSTFYNAIDMSATATSEPWDEEKHYKDTYAFFYALHSATEANVTLTTSKVTCIETPEKGTLSFRISTEAGEDSIRSTGDSLSNVDYLINVYDKDTDELLYSINVDDLERTETTVTDHLCDNKESCTWSHHKRTITMHSFDTEYVTGERIFRPAKSWQNHSGSWGGVPLQEYLKIQLTLPIEATTKGIYISAVETQENGSGTMLQLRIADVSYVYDVQKCGYADGQVISSKQAFGGSNYINETYCNVLSNESGIREGNGNLQIQLASVEYIDNLFLQDVPAPDLAAPAMVDEASVSKTSISGSTVRIIWNVPKDYGTDYYHKAESYNALTGQKLCDSNITLNNLLSGVKGYYYIIDTVENTVVTKNNGTLIETNALTVAMTADVQYLHLATVDVAGNVSGTIHILIGKKDPEVAWKIYTEQIEIAGTDSNIYAAASEKTWYVRADGKTPFALDFDAKLDTAALINYQINYMIFDTTAESSGNIQRYQTYTPSHALASGTFVSGIGDIEKSMTGEVLLEDAAYTVTTRSNTCRDLNLLQHFVLSADFDAQTLDIVPVAGAKQGETIAYSDWTEDKENGIRIIGDAIAPTVQGNEILENMAQIDWNADSVLIDLTCSDTGSGVREFYVVVENQNNYITKTFKADASGHIVIDLADETDYAFAGDFIITIHAVDNVGNDSELTYKTEKFSLTASVERMRAPHEPLLKRGDTGILHISTTGYVDKIEVEILHPIFPEAVVFEYENPEYLQKENVEFFVPLDAPEGTYKISVNAYKNGNKLNAQPVLGVFELSGTVLEEFRRKINWNS